MPSFVGMMIMARAMNVRRILEQYGERAATAAKEALAENAETLIEEARSRVPVRTGRLRDSIRAVPSANGTRIKIVADAKNEQGQAYGAVVEYSPLINEPFLYPAFYATREEMIDHVKEKLKLELRRNR